MNAEELKKKTKEFAHRSVKLAVALPTTALGNHVRKQLIRCATSVASNYRAALLSQTKAVFISKISIVAEEADESEFWLEFIMDENLVTERRFYLFLAKHMNYRQFSLRQERLHKEKKDHQSKINNHQSSKE